MTEANRTIEGEYRKRVLIIAYYFPPMGLSGVQRTLKFAKYLPPLGWKPTVLTVTPTGYFAQDESLLGEVESAGIEVIRTGSLDPTRAFSKRNNAPVVVKMPSEPFRKLLNITSQIFFIPDNKIGWKRRALRAALAFMEREKVDLIFATAPPYTDFLIGAELQRKTGIPLVVDYRDAWYDNPYHFYFTPLHRYLHARLEKRVLRAANKIITINRRIKELLLRRYRFLRYDDVLIVPQGYDPSDFNVDSEALPRTPKMRFTYAGTFIDKRSPKFFLRALKNALARTPEMRGNIEACFLGNFREENRKLVTALGLEDVVNVVGYKGHAETARYLLASDVLWLIIGEGKGEDMMSTGKLFDYIGARKPILGCVPEGVARTVIRESKAGNVTSPYDEHEIEQAIQKLYRDWKSGALPVPDSAFTQKYRRDILTAELARIFEFMT